MRWFCYEWLERAVRQRGRSDLTKPSSAPSGTSPPLWRRCSAVFAVRLPGAGQVVHVIACDDAAD